jgi:ribose transport system substrate-binding protein
LSIANGDLSSTHTAMKKLRVLVSLTNDDNDYQLEQAAAAQKAARQLGVEINVVHANNDAVTQSQQLLQHIQGAAAMRPDAIVFEPAGGTGFPQVARAATAAGMGWVVLNHEADYIHQLRQAHHVPIFSISSDHEEVGEIQGKQFAALLPTGGKVLYIEGPNNSSAARERTAGMLRTKPANIEIKTLRANWTEESAQRAVSSWLRLRTSLESRIDLVGAQDDSMAAGARNAFTALPEKERDRWIKIPLTGCDGSPKTGQAWVRNGLLAATIYIRPNTDLAVEMLGEAIRTGANPPEHTVTAPQSIPSIDQLVLRATKRNTARMQHSAGL